MMFSKAKRCHIVLVLLLIATAVVSTGCPGGGVRPPPQEFYEAPVITGDGAGGIIVFYVTQVGRDFWCRKRRLYVQRIDKEGDSLWGQGVLIGKDYTKLAPDVQPLGFLGPLMMSIAGDGSGGAIVLWRALCPEGIDAIRAARVSPQGDILWRSEFRRRQEPRFLRPMALDVLSDGAGGIIITWLCADDGLLRSQRIDSEGQFPWGETGVVVFKEPVLRYDAVVNKKGALIIVWPRDETILAQKISPQGKLLWPQGGVQVDTLAHAAPQVTNDGQAGAIITWIRWHLREDHTVRGWEVLAQRIDPEGNLLWERGGVPVFTMERSAVRPHLPQMVRIISSGPGEAIISHLVPFYGLLAQKIDCEGGLQWPEGGVLVRRFERGLCVSTVADNYGGAIFIIRHIDRAYRYLLDAYRLDGEGKVLWQGVSVTTVQGMRFSTTPDGRGGAFVAWVAFEFGPLRPYVQRVSAEGEPMWGDRGIQVNR
jgi:hypothetical protein